MNAPQKQKPDDFLRAYLEERKKFHFKDKTLRCISCDTEIKEMVAYVSIHFAEFPDCAGDGAVIRMRLPYCPQCEEWPSFEGCLHVTGALPKC